MIIERKKVMEILKCEGVSKIYGSGETEVRALDNVNFRYTLPDAVGYITAMNETSDNLVKKVIPGARIVDHINRYIKLITEV